MFQRCLAILLMCLILAANFTRLFVYAGFEANQKYIAEKLCENRNRPWLHCNGRCYLMKKIKQAEEKERSTERQIQKSLFQDAFYTRHAPVKFQSTLLQIIPVANQPVASQQVYISLLQPPQIA